MTEFSCEFCGTKFGCSNSLKLHIKTAKYCLKKRGELATTTQQHKCEYCGFTCLRKCTLSNHLKKCTNFKKSNEAYVNNIKLEYIQKQNRKLEKKCLKLRKKAEQLNLELENYKTEIAERDERIAELEKDIEYYKGVLVGIHQPQLIKVEQITDNDSYDDTK